MMVDRAAGQRQVCKSRPTTGRSKRAGAALAVIMAGSSSTAAASPLSPQQPTPTPVSRLVFFLIRRILSGTLSYLVPYLPNLLYGFLLQTAMSPSLGRKGKRQETTGAGEEDGGAATGGGGDDDAPSSSAGQGGGGGGGSTRSTASEEETSSTRSTGLPLELHNALLSAQTLTSHI